MLIVLVRECVELKEAIGLSSKKQELLATSDGGQDEYAGKSLLSKYQEKIFEEYKGAGRAENKKALEPFGRKHKLVNLENERDRARMIQGMELSGAVGDFSGALDSSSLLTLSGTRFG